MAVPAWATEVGIAGTWAIAVIAIWGEWIRSKLFKPKLRLALLNDAGERTRADVIEIRDGQPQIVRNFPVRYYHVRVTNRSRVAAHEVQVFVTQLDLRGPNGQAQTRYNSAHLPLGWRMQQLHDKSRTVGYATAADADLLFVQSDLLKITLMLTPNNFPDTMTGAAGGAHFWLTLVARGLESESAPLRLRINWDGGWHDGDTEMRQHLTIAED